MLSCDNRGKCFQTLVAHLVKLRCGQTQLLKKLLQKHKGISQLPFMMRTKSDGQCTLMKHCIRHQEKKKKPNFSTTKIMNYWNGLPGANEKSIPLEILETEQAKPRMTCLAALCHRNEIDPTQCLFSTLWFLKMSIFSQNGGFFYLTDFVRNKNFSVSVSFGSHDIFSQVSITSSLSTNKKTFLFFTWPSCVLPQCPSSYLKSKQIYRFLRIANSSYVHPSFHLKHSFTPLFYWFKDHSFSYE